MIFKTQFEIRYSVILDFQTQYKKLFASYLPMCEFSIIDGESLNEHIILKFTKENYQLDIRWDRIIFLSEGNRTDLTKSSGPLHIFFEIFEKIKNLSTFSKIQNIICLETILKIYEYNLDDVKLKFVSKYINEESFILKNDGKNDYSIVFSNFKDNNVFKCSFGPFDFSRDVNSFNLSPLNRHNSDIFSEYNGLLIECTSFEETNSCDYNQFKRIYSVLSSYRELISI